MLTMIRALAVEMARYQVTANSILPGWIESDMTAKALADEKFAAAVLPRIPMRRWGTREDFAGIAVYLMSDASRYHTGDSFVIDGAYTIF
jgi:NAD(P)-dependent dehydrogenase (short-subunit alcohol dehydrogenase family)